MPDMQLMEERVYLAHCWSVQSIMKKSWWQALKETGCTHSQEAERDACSYSAPFLFMCLVPQLKEWYLPHLGWIFLN